MQRASRWLPLGSAVWVFFQIIRATVVPAAPPRARDSSWQRERRPQALPADNFMIMAKIERTWRENDVQFDFYFCTCIFLEQIMPCIFCVRCKQIKRIWFAYDIVRFLLLRARAGISEVDFGARYIHLDGQLFNYALQIHVSQMIDLSGRV